MHPIIYSLLCLRCVLSFNMCHGYMKLQIYISVSALKCYKGCFGCPKIICEERYGVFPCPPGEIVDCDTDSPGSDICNRAYVQGMKCK